MSSQNSKLGTIKHAFFNRRLEKTLSFTFKDDDFDLEQLRFEYSSLYRIFLSNKKLWAKDLAAAYYLNYLCDLLICYYKYDYQDSELKKLHEQRKIIEAFIKANAGKNQDQFIADFFKYILDELKKSPKEHPNPFISLSQIRNYISNINSKRSHFSYSRALATELVSFLTQSPFFNFIQQLNETLGNEYGFIEMLNLLNNSRKTIALLGIALFATRFLINFILLLKQVIHAALSDKLSVKKVLKQELEKQAFVMVSDLIWSMVGLLTTYNNFFHISSLYIPPLVLAFLVFDILLLFTQWIFEAQKHSQQLHELLTQRALATPFEQSNIDQQINILNDEWQVNSAYYAINVLGANILAMSFAITLMYTGPLAIAGLALFSLLGNALYNCAEDYRKYQRARVAVKRELANGEILNDNYHKTRITELNDACAQRFNDYLFSLAFNVGGIAFIIAAAVISWPVALCITAGYITYHLSRAYSEHVSPPKNDEIPHDVYRILCPKIDNEPVFDSDYCHCTL